MRKALSLAIAQDQDLAVAGTAVNGCVALAKFPALKPDIVLLDFGMPEIELRKIESRVPIIMFSSLLMRTSDRRQSARIFGMSSREMAASVAAMSTLLGLVT